MATSTVVHGAIFAALWRYGAVDAPPRLLPFARGEDPIEVVVLYEMPELPPAEVARPAVPEAPNDPAHAGHESRRIVEEAKPQPAPEEPVTSPPVSPAPTESRPEPREPPAPDPVEPAATPEPAAAPQKPVEDLAEPERPAPREDRPSRPAVGGLREGAHLAEKITPRYPRSCRRRNHQGTVRLEIEVSATGRVVSVRVLSSAGCERLDRAAEEAIRRARFQPARLGRQSVPSTVVLPIAFRLR